MKHVLCNVCASTNIVTPTPLYMGQIFNGENFTIHVWQLSLEENRLGKENYDEW